MEEPDALFTPKHKSKNISYTQSKSSFSLGYFIIYIYVRVQDLFPISWRKFHSVEYLCVKVYCRISAPQWV